MGVLMLKTEELLLTHRVYFAKNRINKKKVYEIEIAIFNGIRIFKVAICFLKTSLNKARFYGIYRVRCCNASAVLKTNRK